MAENLRERLMNLTVKSGMLVERFEEMKQQKALALKRIEELETELRTARGDIEALRRQVESLRIAHGVAAADGSQASKTELAEILREIDKCIVQLKY